jgi:hypothetical protein
MYFCTGPTGRKAKNLALSPLCVLTTGCNALGEALVYEVIPSTAFGFGKGEFSQTRWRFEPA